MKGKWKLRDTGWCWGCDAATTTLGKKCPHCGYRETKCKGRNGTRRSRKGMLRKIRKGIIEQHIAEYGDDSQR